jgi:hypothetical protein
MKRFAFVVAAVMFVVLASEAISFVVYAVHTRHLPSVTQLRRERAALAGAPQDATEDAGRLVRRMLDAPDVRPTDQIVAEVLHPYLGFVYSPEHDDASFRAIYGMGISRWGFVDDKDPIQLASPDRLVVGIFGGSVAWYLSKESAETIIDGLRTVPAFRDKEVVIVRTALFGYKQPQQLLALTYLLSMGAHFDVIINLDGFNEAVLPVTENLQKRVFPFYPRTWFLRVADSPTSRSVVEHVLSLRAWRRTFAQTVTKPIVGRSMTANIAWKLIDESVSNTINREQVEWLKQPASDGNYAATGPFTPYPDEALMYRDLADKWKTASLQMSRLARANGSAYFHFLQPNQYVPGSKPMSADERAIAIDEGFMFAHPARTGYPYLVAAGLDLLREGVWFQDLTRLFADVTLPVYRDNCCHLEKRGNEMLAATIASAISQKLR